MGFTCKLFLSSERATRDIVLSIVKDSGEEVKPRRELFHGAVEWRINWKSGLHAVICKPHELKRDQLERWLNLTPTDAIEFYLSNMHALHIQCFEIALNVLKGNSDDAIFLAESDSFIFARLNGEYIIASDDYEYFFEAEEKLMIPSPKRMADIRDIIDAEYDGIRL